MHLAPSWQTPHFRHSVIQKRNGITPCICMITTNATISCKILVKIGPVVSAENSLIEIALRVHVVVCRISSNISVEVMDRFSQSFHVIFSPHESGLHADDGYVPYFPICQGTLPWQPNNVAVMQAKWATCILCTFAYLLGGATVVPSGLLGRLCRAFLIFTYFHTHRRT